MNLHLYKMIHEDDYTYLISTIEDKEKLREWNDIFDHGGTPYDIWLDIWQKGEIVEITSLDQVPEKDLSMIPYCTDEKIIESNYPYGGEYPFLGIECEIGEFFDVKQEFEEEMKNDPKQNS